MGVKITFKIEKVRLFIVFDISVNNVAYSELLIGFFFVLKVSFKNVISII